MVSEWGKFLWRRLLFLHSEALIYNTMRKKIVDEDVNTQEGSSNAEMYTAPETVNAVFLFSENYVLNSTVGCINDNQKLSKNRDTPKQQEQNLFCNSVKIYYSTV